MFLYRTSSCCVIIDNRIAQNEVRKTFASYMGDVGKKLQSCLQRCVLSGLLIFICDTTNRYYDGIDDDSLVVTLSKPTPSITFQHNQQSIIEGKLANQFYELLI